MFQSLFQSPSSNFYQNNIPRDISEYATTTAIGDSLHFPNSLTHVDEDEDHSVNNHRNKRKTQLPTKLNLDYDLEIKKVRTTDLYKMSRSDCSSNLTEKENISSLNHRPQKCKKCGFFAKDKDEYYSHIREHIPKEKQLSCTICQFVTEYKHHLYYHMSGHFNWKPFTCKQCDYHCINAAMLKSHMKCHLKGYQMKCGTCLLNFTKPQELINHLKHENHSPVGNISEPLRDCGFEWKNLPTTSVVKTENSPISQLAQEELCDYQSTESSTQFSPQQHSSSTSNISNNTINENFTMITDDNKNNNLTLSPDSLNESCHSSGISSEKQIELPEQTNQQTISLSTDTTSTSKNISLEASIFLLLKYVLLRNNDELNSKNVCETKDDLKEIDSTSTNEECGIRQISDINGDSYFMYCKCGFKTSIKNHMTDHIIEYIRKKSLNTQTS
ncbi:hypothetical protein SNEBB_010348 [Seison nebaliae]|nr:hypothetical protein SNEBB_010348 [Seison nebaliae]